jgi:hypothetical protein
VASFFDSVSKDWLVRFVEHRIGDLRIIRLIQKWGAHRPPIEPRKSPILGADAVQMAKTTQFRSAGSRSLR